MKGVRIYVKLRILTLILISLITFTSNQVIAFPGETRAYFKDWLVMCQEKTYSSDSVGICRANTAIRNKALFPYGDGTVFQFTIQRDDNTEYHIEFYHTLDDSYPSDTVKIKIDDFPETLLNVSIEGNLARLTVEQSRPLILQIKEGHRLKISYLSSAREYIDVKISLRGSTASLLFIDQFYYNRGY
jgi:invasion protein IalB